jgi:hypothetical protein
MEKKKLLISFSGGRTSAYMLWWLFNYWEDRNNWNIVVVFANTGKEAPETLVFVHQCSIYWNIPIVWVEGVYKDEAGNSLSEKGWKVSHRVVDYFTAARGKELTDGTFEMTPFEEMISLLGIPTTGAPFCSDQLKRKVIESYLSSINFTDYYKALGIRIDEPKRINPKYKEKQLLYPLVSLNQKTKPEILYWWDLQNFNLTVDPDEGNCDGCWKKDLLTLCRNARKKPELYRWWQYITDKYGYLNPRDSELLPPFNFYRGNISPADIIELSKLDDDKISLHMRKNNFNRCSESCEAF